VVVQFAIVIGLIFVTATIYRQTQFALHDALRLDTSQNVTMQTACRSSFRQQLAALPGVKAVSCGDQATVSAGGSSTLVTMPDRSVRTVISGVVDVGFFEMHGLKPLAGRFPSRAHSEDVLLDKPVPGPYPDLQPSLVVNESAARLLGYSRPADAIGKTITWKRWSASTNNFTSARCARRSRRRSTSSIRRAAAMSWPSSTATACPRRSRRWTPSGAAPATSACSPTPSRAPRCKASTTT
jgi:hypothetical protein